MIDKLQLDILKQYFSVHWLSIVKELWYQKSRNLKCNGKTGQVINVNAANLISVWFNKTLTGIDAFFAKKK